MEPKSLNLRCMEPKSRQLIVSLPLELIDRWPPSTAIITHNYEVDALETNASVGYARVQTREW